MTINLGVKALLCWVSKENKTRLFDVKFKVSVRK